MDKKQKSSMVTDAKLDVSELSKVSDSGAQPHGDGCQSRVCENNRNYGAIEFCSNAVCTEGIGVCISNT